MKVSALLMVAQICWYHYFDRSPVRSESAVMYVLWLLSASFRMSLLSTPPFNSAKQ